MQCGIYAPNCWDYGSPRALLDLAKCAEQAGWDGFFIWDHLLMGSRTPVADPQVTLAAIAACTDRLQLGTLLTPLARRRPWKVARELASLNSLAPGRIVLGVGLGMPDDYSPFSTELEDGVRRAAGLDDGIDLLRELLNGQDVAWTQPRERTQILRLDSALTVNAPGFVPSAPDLRIWGGGRIQRDPSKNQLMKPFKRAARLNGLFPVASDWNPEAPLSPEELRLAVELTFGEDQANAPEGFDLVTCGRTRGAAATVDPADYHDLGLTWWLETMPDTATVGVAAKLIEQRPPDS